MTDKEKAIDVLDEIIRLANQIDETSHDFMDLEDSIYSKAGYNFSLVMNLTDSLSTFARDCKFRLNHEMQ